MKKIISIVLAVIMTLSCLAVVAFATEGGSFTKSYSVTVAPDCQEKLAITSLSGVNYVIEGGTFKFTVEAVNGYVFDQTTVIKIANTDYYSDVMTNTENDYGYILEPDSDGVYTIENVTEDMHVYVANLDKSSFAGLKDFLMNMMNFFLNLMKWFFGV